MEAPLIFELKNVNKSFCSAQRKLEVLKNISLSVCRSSVTGFIGRSGAGKSTLLRCLNLLEKPDSGEVWMGQTELTQASSEQLKKVRQKIGMVFQAFHLLSHQTAFDNVALPLKIMGLKKSQIFPRVREIASLVGLSDKLDFYPAQLSGGQKQRVAIARALVSHPEVLLCDEFTSALDLETTSEILDLIRDMKAKLGITVILVTHDLSVVQTICDQVHVLDAGTLVESGSVESVLQRSQHSLIQSFLSQGRRESR
jgi:D-methionine transport system ATP-binding protein